MQDLAEPENELPDDLRASLISIGIWILKEADAVRIGEQGSISEIRDITAIIRDGLK
jgi:flagellar protein FlaF